MQPPQIFLRVSVWSCYWRRSTRRSSLSSTVPSGAKRPWIPKLWYFKRAVFSLYGAASNYSRHLPIFGLASIRRLRGSHLSARLGYVLSLAKPHYKPEKWRPSLASWLARVSFGFTCVAAREGRATFYGLRFVSRLPSIPEFGPVPTWLKAQECYQKRDQIN